MFKPATKVGTKVRAALFGVSGAGKTFTALRIAYGIASMKPGSRIAVIDSENRTASKYSDRFRFDVNDLADNSVNAYMKALDEARGYDILIIDSLSHGWQELLVEVDKLAATKFKNNRWSAWSEGTPKQHRFIQALQSHPAHIIATMRSKTEWNTVNDGGKLKPVRVGLTPEQGKNIEYEFDVLMDLNEDHIGHVIKDRSGLFQDQYIEKPGEEFGRRLAEWLSDAAPAPVAQLAPIGGGSGSMEMTRGTAPAPAAVVVGVPRMTRKY